MEPLNRVALIVRPKRRYKEWADSIVEEDDEPVFDLDLARANPAVYLVAADPEQSLPELIDQYAAEVFEEQLEAWHTDESTWPINRTPHVFRDWFDVVLGDSVIDLDPEESFHFEDEGEEDLLDALSGVPGALTSCAWCGETIDAKSPVVAVMLKGPRDPHPEPEVIELTVAGRIIQAVVPSDESKAAREGVMAFATFCSDDCGRSFQEAWRRERDALTS
jgi:hypothetical protein